MKYLDGYGIVYLATPYSKYEPGHVAAFLEAAKLAGYMVNHGVMVFSPISHGHPMTAYGAVNPYDHPLWMQLDKHFMDMCDALVVATMDGWDESRGVQEEIKIFLAAGKPLYKINPKTLDVEKFDGHISKRKKKTEKAAA